MEFKGIGEALSAVLSPFIRWFECLRTPSHCWRLLTYPDLSEKAKINGSLELWVAISVIAFVIMLPAYRFTGVKFDDVAFFAPYILLSIVSQLAAATTTHIVFRTCRIASRFSDTLAIYTVTIGAYSPIVSLLTTPAAISVLRAIRIAKEEGASLVDMSMYLDGATTTGELGVDINVQVLGGILAVFIVLVATVLFARFACEYYGAEKIRVWTSAGLAVGVTLPLTNSALGLLYLYLFYVAA